LASVPKKTRHYIVIESILYKDEPQDLEKDPDIPKA